MVSENLKLVADRARKLYDERYRSRLELTDEGAYVCIEPDSEQIFLGRSFDEAVNRAIDAFPDRLTHTLRIGHSAALHLGAMA